MTVFLADDIEVINGYQLDEGTPFIMITKAIPCDDDLRAAVAAERDGKTMLLGMYLAAFKTSKGRTWTARSGWRAT